MALTGDNLDFLKACFEEKEWQYLQNLHKFAALIAGASNCIEDAEQLAEIGVHLIAEWEAESRTGEN